MVNETVPKDILDKLNAGIEIIGTDVDIRDLTSVSDSVEVLQDTYADCKVEVHTADGTILPTGIYGWDGGLWETLNTDTNNRLLTKPTQTTTKQLYTYSFNEWIMENGTKIGGFDTADDTAVTIYTVPANKAAYITSMGCGAVGEFAAELAVKLIAGGIVSLLFYTVGANIGTSTVTSNPTIPIKLTVGQTVQVQTTSGDFLGVGFFTGYEIDA